MKSQGIAAMITFHPEGGINVCTKFDGKDIYIRLYANLILELREVSGDYNVSRAPPLETMNLQDFRASIQ